MNFRSRTRRRLDLSLELLERSTRDFSEFCRNWIDSPLWSLSVATTRTLRVLPPSVAISALSVFRRRDLRISMSSGMRSERSSQHREALNMRRPSLSSQPPWSSLSPLVDKTETSSVSDGNASESDSEDICCFNSLTRWTTLARREALSV